MSVRLETQIRDYATYYGSTLPAIEMPTVEVGPAAPSRSPLRLAGGARRWAVAMGAALIVLVLVGGVAAGVRWLSGAAPAVDEQTTTTTLDDLTLPILDDWVRVPDEGDVFGRGGGEVVMEHVMRVASGLVAFGYWAGGESGVFNGTAVWTSADGIEWQLTPFDESWRDAQFRGVANTPAGFVAVGSYWPEEDWATGASFVGTAAIWTSVDGSTWTRMLLNKGEFGVAILNDVASTPEGLVAGGWVCSEEPFIDESPDCHAAIWFSPNGAAWEEVYRHQPTDGEVIGFGVSQAGLVAVGNCCTKGSSFGEGRSNAFVWFSENGKSWAAVDDDSAFADAEIGPVVGGNRGYLAIGHQPDGSTVVWTSADGTTWDNRVQEVSGITTSDVVVADIGEMYVAVAGEAPIRLFTSIDGVTWDEILVDSTPGMAQSVTLGGPGIVIVGMTDTDEGVTAAVWVSPSVGLPPIEFVEPAPSTRPTLPDGPSAAEFGWHRVDIDREQAGEGWMAGLVAGGPGFVSVGYDKVARTGVVWASADGLIWERVALPASVNAAETWLDAVATDGSRLLAVGLLMTDQQTSAVGLWESDDGTTWSEVALPQDFEGSFFFMDIAFTPNGWIIVGNSFTDEGPVGSVWHSADGEAWTLVLEARPGLVSGVTAADDGAAVLGGALNESGEMTTTIWLSLDGVTWRVVLQDADAEASVSGDIVRWAGGLAATGGGQAVWASSDGLDWELIANFESVEVRAIAPRESGLVVAGRGDGGTVDVWVWGGEDNLPWGLVPVNGDVFGPLGSGGMHEIIQEEPGLVGVGQIFTDKEIPSVWIWTAVAE